MLGAGFFYYKAHPLDVRDNLTDEQYELALLPGNCAHCGNVIEPQEFQEVSLCVEGGYYMRINTEKAKLCAHCFPIAVESVRKENEKWCGGRDHLIPHDELLYTETIKRESGGNDYREHWQMV